jgi:CheY-like chemotaxis protein
LSLTALCLQVLMDESMPVLRGTAACEVWRAAERAAGVRRRARICLASAGAAPVSQHYDQFLLKPLALADLKRELAKLLA